MLRSVCPIVMDGLFLPDKPSAALAHNMILQKPTKRPVRVFGDKTNIFPGWCVRGRRGAGRE